LSAGWKLSHPPREWQEKALAIWEREKRGVVEVVTGGGKTYFAQLCLLSFFRENPDGKALIIVPSASLLDQWAVDLQGDMGVQPNQIGLLSGDEKPRGSEPITIAVINSARAFSEQFARSEAVFLIVDECHRAGSPENARALEGKFAATLGLSATPEREYDEGFETYIKPALGQIIYQYDYTEAARDGVISEFELANVRVKMLDDEQEKYDDANRRIARYLSSNPSVGNDENVKRLLQRRAAISATATLRIPMSVKLAERHRDERTVIFHERTDAADAIHRILEARGFKSTVYHAKLGPNIRRDNLRLFRSGVFDVLVCCRALDEGVNVPEASVAVIASATASGRQRIQRLGRILRKAPGKRQAIVYTIFATKEEQDRLFEEARNLEGTAKVKWLSGLIEDA
jgi:superfamily II DNA or RNA helicase